MGEHEAEQADPTQAARMLVIEEINAEPGSREALEAEYGKVWDTEELSKDFTVEGFMAPFVVVIKKATGNKGVLMFQDRPRFYFLFKEE